MNNKTDLLKRGMKYREKGAGFPAPSLFKILPKDLFAFGIDRRAQSHGVCMGGDTLVPFSIMVVTRNAAGDALLKTANAPMCAPMARFSWPSAKIGSISADAIACTWN